MRFLLVIGLSLGFLGCPPPAPDNSARDARRTSDSGSGSLDGGASRDVQADTGASADDAGPAEDSGPPPPPTREGALQIISEAACRQIRHCSQTTLSGSHTRHTALTYAPSQLLIFEDLAACQNSIRRSFELLAPATSQRLRINLERQEACLNFINDDCSLMNGGLALCDGFFEPQVAAEGACFNGFECQNDGYCNRPGNACGTCITRGSEGQACGPGAPCQRGLRCSDRACAPAPPPAVTGAACSAIAGVSCSDARDLCTDGICTRMELVEEVGAACSAEGTVLCGAGMYCIAGQCTDRRLNSGQACARPRSGNRPEPLGVCGSGTVCFVEGDAGTCRRPGATGATCRQHDHCRSGYFCDRTARRCRAHEALGASCSHHSACTSNICDPYSDRCAPNITCP